MAKGVDAQSCVKGGEKGTDQGRTSGSISEKLVSETFLNFRRRIENSANPYAALASYACKLKALPKSNECYEYEVNCFRRIIDQHSLEDAPEILCRYLLDLLDCKSLMFEEMCKIFYLLEDIEALCCFDLCLPEQRKDEVKVAFKSWVASEKGRARTVALATVLPEAGNLWFYKYVLSSS